MATRTAEVLLDDARPGKDRVRRFANPLAIVQVRDPRLVNAGLQILQNARNTGRYAAGYFSYELGYVLEKKLRARLPSDRDMPLFWFGIFDSCEELAGEAARNALTARLRGRSYAGPLRHEWSEPAYRERFDKLHGLIASGDIYQASLSFRSDFAAVGDPMALYWNLRARSGASHCAFIDDGERHILSLSPELFFSIAADGKITTRPMKGTAARGGNPLADMMTRLELRGSEKNRAENLMIVDLLRNDLGRVAETGSVVASDLFSIETYPTVHQMVSTVEAKLRPDTTVAELVRALFPSGSVTGTPKIRAMEIISDLEDSPRGVYCGSIGYFAPDGSAEFNVAIRTLTVGGCMGQLGIGGAVIFDSAALAEYNECLLKARYFDTVRKPLELIETLRRSPDGAFIRENLHLERMARSAVTFGMAFDVDRARASLRQSVLGKAGNLRVRLALNEEGRFSCNAMALAEAPPSAWCYRIASIATSSRDVLLQHKTNWRETYEEALLREKDCDEVIFVNERGHLTEGSRTNIFLRRGDKLVTPALHEGVLGGCLRRELIESGACEEAELSPGDLESADEMFLGNSLRGLIPAVVRAAACA